MLQVRTVSKRERVKTRVAYFQTPLTANWRKSPLKMGERSGFSFCYAGILAQIKLERFSLFRENGEAKRVNFFHLQIF